MAAVSGAEANTLSPTGRVGCAAPTDQEAGVVSAIPGLRILGVAPASFPNKPLLPRSEPLRRNFLWITFKGCGKPVETTSVGQYSFNDLWD